MEHSSVNGERSAWSYNTERTEQISAALLRHSAESAWGHSMALGDVFAMTHQLDILPGTTAASQMRAPAERAFRTASGPPVSAAPLVPISPVSCLGRRRCLGAGDNDHNDHNAVCGAVQEGSLGRTADTSCNPRAPTFAMANTVHHTSAAVCGSAARCTCQPAAIIRKSSSHVRCRPTPRR